MSNISHPHLPPGEGTISQQGDAPHPSSSSSSSSITPFSASTRAAFEDDDFLRPVETKRSNYDDVDTSWWQPPDLTPWRDDSVSGGRGRGHNN